MQTSARTQGQPDKMRAGALKKQWTIRPADNRSAQLARSLKVSPLLAQILINRGITDTGEGSAFLRPKLTELINPSKCRESWRLSKE